MLSLQVVSRRRKRALRLAVGLLGAVLLLPACAPQSQNIKPRVFKPAGQLPNSRTSNGVAVAVQAYQYPGQGLDYRKAGIHPVRITISNDGTDPVLLGPENVVAHGSDGNLYLTYTPQEASQLVINSHAMEEAAKGAATGAVTGAAVGALVGLAIGAIFGVNLGRTAAVGAVSGGVGGATGGIRAWLARLRAAAQAEIDNNALRKNMVAAGFTQSGWLYFPGHVQLDEVRVAVANAVSNSMEVYRLPLE